MSNATSLFDLSILLLATIIIIFCSPFFKCIVILIYIAYLYYHKKDILVYGMYLLKNIVLFIPLFLILMLVGIKLISILSFIIAIDFFITGLYLLCKEYSSMEIYFAFSCILAPLDFIGLNSTKIAWKITRLLRNIKIYYWTYKNSVKDNIGFVNNFKNNPIYDKINTSKQKISVINKIAKLKILQLDQMMYLRLFDVNYYRTNYYAKDVKLSDFIFMILLFIVLISEVII